METVADLTTEQFTDLLKDFYAPPEKRSKMTTAEIKEMANKF